MSVKRSKARRLNDGQVRVTMDMSVAAWAVLETAAAQDGYFGAADYLAALVNTQVNRDEAELGLWPREADYHDDDADPHGDGIPF